MSFTPYLSSVAAALMKRVHPAVTDERSRDALEACVRAIAGMAAALEVPGATELDALTLPPGVWPEAMPQLISDPPENLAANDQSAARISVAADWLARGTWLNDAQAASKSRAMLRWERQILRTKIADMAALERGGDDADADLAKLVIDRGALERYLAGRGDLGLDLPIAHFRQTIGGRSRQTAVFSLQAIGEAPRGLVVQRDHPASISSFGVIGQFPVLDLVARSELKTSRPVLLETDPAVLGAPFMVLEQARGTLAGPDYFDPPKDPALACELAVQLAILHRIDPLPLAGKINVPVDAAGEACWQDDLARLEVTWRNFRHAPSLTISAALAWMRLHVAAPGREQAIVHNDAAFHNILVEGGRFSALLDWELVHVGHPAEDLGYCRAFVQEIAPWNDFMAAYVAAGGRQFPKVVIDYFSLRAGIHLMTLLQYGRSMFTSGVTSDINLAEAATSFMQKHHGRIATMLDAILDSEGW